MIQGSFGWSNWSEFTTDPTNMYANLQPVQFSPIHPIHTQQDQVRVWGRVRVANELLDMKLHPLD